MSKKRRTWDEHYITQTGTPESPALLEHMVYLSRPHGELIVPVQKALRKKGARTISWELKLPTRGTKHRHAGFFETVEQAKRAAREGVR